MLFSYISQGRKACHTAIPDFYIHKMHTSGWCSITMERARCCSGYRRITQKFNHNQRLLGDQCNDYCRHIGSSIGKVPLNPIICHTVTICKDFIAMDMFTFSNITFKIVMIFL